MRLTELFTHGEGQYFIAYKEHLWLFDDSDFETEEDEETQMNMISTLNKYDIEIEDDQTWYDISMMLSDEEIDANMVVGQIINNAIAIEADSNFRHSVASKTLLKVMDELGVERVSIRSRVFDDEGNDHEVEYEHTRDEFIEPLSSKSFYHGTSLKYLFSIMKKGVMPSPQQTNYTDIEHEDKVFITLNPERAQFHAITTANKSKSFPVIIKVNIPDVSKLVLDYDVAIQLYGYDHHQTVTLGYDSVLNHATQGAPINIHKPLTTFVPNDELHQIRDKSSLNTKLGVFGYMGRIPSTMIKEIWVDEENIKNHILSDYGFDDKANIESFNHFTPKEFIEFYKETKEEIEDELNDEEDEDY